MAKADIEDEHREVGSDTVTEPVAISLIAGRYLLFDINVVTYLRRTHNICGVLIGGIPQIPQQNVFLGLPLELLPEEARLLVEKRVAYIVDDAAWHKPKFSTLSGEERRRYLDSLREAGLKSKRAADEGAKKRQAHGLAKEAATRRAKGALKSDSDEKDIPDSAKEVSHSLFGDERPQSPTPSTLSVSNNPHAITPTTTYPPLSLPDIPTEETKPPVPSSYPLFTHLHSRGYFTTPGLRFGCDYTAYPGDPLRFHSHFLATGYGWEEEIPMLDIVGGGRLGTGVKKGFLIGGAESKSSTKGDNVRTFCIEWGGM
ncbi:tRNA-splicing endonuclease subunit Sen34 [Coleophoma cylindrospora]|uniref:tRNA-splicing endonuclease subunit Sen34 n=1 Tax=Coleophoma cylindrospora TaxID=1849047 RepID=A0A3D8R729_9HELO|nr:tRNA-splicing endonuclease subunit Sen34 [Coleophoma cylindrospora]